MSQSSSLLLGLDGITVESVEIAEDRIRTVHVLTAADRVGMCPGCAIRSSRSKGWVATRPRDVKIGSDRPDRMAEAEVVVHQQLMSTEVFHGVGAVDPAAGSHDGTGQVRNGAGCARRRPVGQGGRRRLRLQLEHLP